jgi:hypothetical protein
MAAKELNAVLKMAKTLPQPADWRQDLRKVAPDVGLEPTAR